MSLVKKNVTERPPESICMTKTNSETKCFSFEKSFFRSQKNLVSNFHQLFFGKETLRSVSSNELDWPNPFKGLLPGYTTGFDKK